MTLLRPMPLRANSMAAWIFAGAALLAALAVRFAFVGVLPRGTAFAAFIPAIILIAFFSGFWPAVVAVFAAGWAGWYFFLQPGVVLDSASAWALNFGPFLGICLLVVPIVFAMRMSLAALDRERARSAALADQRETLFRELQHRISNNLAIVSALLNLQRAEIIDTKARAALSEASTRLALIAKIQRNLHDPSGAGHRFGPFVESLCRDVLDASGASHVKCAVTAADIPISEDKLIPIALIVAELISNALEHGFAGRPQGNIQIELTANGSDHILVVADDGNGLPREFSLDAAPSMGLKIVSALAHQIGGRFALENEAALDKRGARALLVFQAAA